MRSHPLAGARGADACGDRWERAARGAIRSLALAVRMVVAALGASETQGHGPLADSRGSMPFAFLFPFPFPFAQRPRASGRGQIPHRDQARFTIRSTRASSAAKTSGQAQKPKVAR